uniref:Uncharacterized protein n=1 Tax=Romanomermis culicivorax TaxID=13658 RepID=A0A915JBD5_ROMCU
MTTHISSPYFSGFYVRGVQDELIKLWITNNSQIIPHEEQFHFLIVKRTCAIETYFKATKKKQQELNEALTLQLSNGPSGRQAIRSSVCLSFIVGPENNTYTSNINQRSSNANIKK